MECVLNRKMAEKLRDAGYTQASEYMWAKFENTDWMLVPRELGEGIHVPTSVGERTEAIPAPSSFELLDQLPKTIDTREITICVVNTGIIIKYEDSEKKSPPITAYLPPSTRRIDELCNVWIWLHNNMDALSCDISQSKPSEAV